MAKNKRRSRQFVRLLELLDKPPVGYVTTIYAVRQSRLTQPCKPKRLWL